MSQGAHLEILRPFQVTCGGRRVAVSNAAQRLLAFLALHREGTHRRSVAAQLWPDCTSCRASANLRSALCQGRKLGPVPAIDSVDHSLALAPSFSVDFHKAWDAAHRLVSGDGKLPDGDRLVADLSQTLLPGWDDEWLLLERERWDQLRLYALEALAQQFQTEGRHLSALQTSLAAVSIDPFRETPHRIAVEVHLAEGNVACAVKRYQDYRRLLQMELKVAPSPQLTRLVRDLTRT
ncbi:BTAD domain-containing putative transcriptional regulator [Streptomyces sp. MB09-01]|uniref:AfsR/SARP family transcriptional regulator n=1 Tax=Streptomyces sp. MB09-01 TaxID=3028666 RepID=UPI0029B4CD57|nr:BTAD domain-containing putative transcriptional regulator [Streptomyces sp. MB09-01]MDX3539293.1 BTAD domain-containing putative transcriptional regulator [Streptomyces sp. MB09-01]